MTRPTKSHSININGSEYLLASDDNYLIDMSGVFEPEICNLFSSLIEKQFQIVDVGANVGCTTILFAQLGKNVVSYEPSPTTFKLLSYNLKENALLNVRVDNCGLGSKNENLTLTFAPSHRSGGFVSNHTQASEGHITENIVIKRGDDLLLNDQINFIKIDVEGFEKNVIEGLNQTIKRNQPIVVLELNHWCLNAFQRTSVPDFFDFLSSVFPMLYAVDGKDFLDLNDASQRYIAMYNHILHFKYPNIIGAFDKAQLKRFFEYCAN